METRLQESQDNATLYQMGFEMVSGSCSQPQNLVKMEKIEPRNDPSHKKYEKYGQQEYKVKNRHGKGHTKYSLPKSKIQASR